MRLGPGPHRAGRWGVAPVAACVGAALAVLVTLAAAGTALAQRSALVPPPWRPAGEDTLSLWAGESRALLLGSSGPDLGEQELRAFALQDRIVRSYFRELGPRRMEGAAGVLAVLDTLKLTARLSQKEEYPTFVLVHFFNPHFEKYASLAYLYWFRGEELRSQPINLKGGAGADLQVFWTGDAGAPYEAGILYYQGDGVSRMPELLFFRMLPKADAWLPIQVGDVDLRLGGRGTAMWADLDRDAKPELISWTEGIPDTFFIPCDEPGCPKLVTQRTFVRGAAGFRLYERRTLASPYATFILFLRALSQGEEAFAAGLTRRPEVMGRARELGWVGLRRPRAFAAVPMRNMGTWSERLRCTYAAPGKPTTLLEVRFANDEGHWLIDEVVILSRPGAPADGDAPSGRVSPPGGPAGEGSPPGQGARR